MTHTNSQPNKGQLVIVGTGINVSGQMTATATAEIKQADVVFAAIYGAPAFQYIKSLNNNIVDLTPLYSEGKSRKMTYQEMTDLMVSAAREGKKAVAAFYGHPGVFATPTHNAVTLCRAEGITVRMEPGISAEDCLIADLGIDSGLTGFQTFEANQFLYYKHSLNPHNTVVLWQIGIVGEHTFETFSRDTLALGLSILTEKLLSFYPADQKVIIYRAATTAFEKTLIEEMPLSSLPQSNPCGMSTLVIPSRGLPEHDQSTMEKMGATAEKFSK